MLKLLIFGAGGGGRKIGQLINPTHAGIIAYVDNDHKKIGSKIENKSIISPSEILDKKFDYIMIASAYYESIQNQLNKMGISDENIICVTKFVQGGFKFLVDKFAEEDQVELLITGLSYAKRGIISELLVKKAFNFAMESQDIYIDYHIVRFLVQNKINTENVKYCIVCLAYYSFEYDLSLSIKKHLVYRYNRLLNTFHDGMELENEFLETEKKLTHILKENYFDLFYNSEKDNYEKQINRVKESKKEFFHNQAHKSSEEFKIAQKNAKIDFKKNYPHTTSANIDNLSSYVEFLRNHNILPIIIVLPVSKQYYESIPQEKKILFHNTIQQIRRRYPLQYHDFIQHSLFESYDFYDGSHLTRPGAKKFTNLLNNQLKF